MKKNFIKVLILFGVCVGGSLYANDNEVEYFAPYVFEDIVIDDTGVDYFPPYVFEGGTPVIVSPNTQNTQERSPNALERSLDAVGEGLRNIRLPRF